MYRQASNLGVVLCHHLHELLEVYPPVPVLVSVLDHLLDLSLRKSLPHALADLCELLNAERPSAVLVEDLEELLQAGLALVVSVEAEDGKKCLEVHFCV
jgi:hypothetical protein